MIIDVHAHTSNHKMLGLHTENAKIEDLERMANKYGVQKIILLATYFPFKKSGLKNKELLERIRGKDLFLSFGSLDAMNHLKEGIRELEDLLSERLIQGIKLYPGYQNFDPSDESLFPIYSLAKKYAVPVMFHTGELHHCCSRKERIEKRYRCKAKECWIDLLGHLSEPQKIEFAVWKFPDLKFLLSHLGNPYFNQLRQLMKRYDNIYTDISGQFLSGTEEDTPEYRQTLKEEISKFLDLPFGLGRVLFGTDFPIQSYKDSIQLIEDLGLSE